MQDEIEQPNVHSTKDNRMIRKNNNVFQSLGKLERHRSKPSLVIETNFMRCFNPSRFQEEKRRSEALIKQYREPDFIQLIEESANTSKKCDGILPLSSKYTILNEDAISMPISILDPNKHVESAPPKLNNQMNQIPIIHVEKVNRKRNDNQRQVDFENRSIFLEHYKLKPNKTDRHVLNKKSSNKKTNTMSSRNTSRGLSLKKINYQNGVDKEKKQGSTHSKSKLRNSLGRSGKGVTVELFRSKMNPANKTRKSRDISPNPSKSSSVPRISVQRIRKISGSLSFKEASTRRENNLINPKPDNLKTTSQTNNAKVYFVRKPLEKSISKNKKSLSTQIICHQLTQNSRRKKMIGDILDVKNYLTKTKDRENPHDLKNMFRAQRCNIFVGKLSPGMNSSFRTADSQNMTSVALK